MYGIELGDLEKGTQATQAEIIAEMNRDRHEENAYEKINEPNETNAAIQTRYGDIIAETGAPAVEKYLNKSLSDKNKSATNGHAWVAAEGAVSSKQDRNENIDDNGKLDDMTPMPPPPPPPVEFSEVDVHRDDWQKDDFPEPPSSPLDLDVAAEEATSELVNLVKEQAAELENTGIDNQAFQPDDGTIRTEL
ncbi:uncharacterized protein LOC117106349 [Anneissia japonica]|uniref:uncharacterized protein LOC117106349 n=1 Tax=Anneissia japonica TaxID=1529436 RepID=UPI00142583CB|nr:uncharacterized protein LOC117106349 [Anneissia japonica]